MDPSVAMEGESAALVDRDAFLGLLERDGLVAIWTVAGEKNAYGDSPGDGFGDGLPLRGCSTLTVVRYVVVIGSKRSTSRRNTN